MERKEKPEEIAEEENCESESELEKWNRKNWTLTKEKELCHLWEVEKGLYDGNCKDYRNTDKQAEAMKRIADGLGYKEKELVLRMRTLRTSFTKMVKADLCIDAMTGRQKEIYDMCKFLYVHVKHRAPFARKRKREPSTNGKKMRLNKDHSSLFNNSSNDEHWMAAVGLQVEDWEMSNTSFKSPDSDRQSNGAFSEKPVVIKTESMSPNEYESHGSMDDSQNTYESPDSISYPVGAPLVGRNSEDTFEPRNINHFDGGSQIYSHIPGSVFGEKNASVPLAGGPPKCSGSSNNSGNFENDNTHDSCRTMWPKILSELRNILGGTNSKIGLLAQSVLSFATQGGTLLNGGNSRKESHNELWARLLSGKLEKMEPKVRERFKVFVDGMALDAIDGDWPPKKS